MSSGTVSRIIADMRKGDAGAIDRLFPVVYSTLKQVSRAQLRGAQGAELCTTELVHEAYLKLLGSSPTDWQGRSHFLAVAARAMRQILVDHARRRLAGKRGGGHAPVTLLDCDGSVRMGFDELLALDEALDRLDALNPQLRRVVELRYFSGMSEREVAEALSVTTRTVGRAWVKARLFLHRELYPEADESRAR